jgi:hypothetical protein
MVGDLRMSRETRREAIKLAAGVAIVGASAAVATGAPKKKPKANDEKPVPSKAIPENYGPREMFAVVDAQGTLRRGFHAVSAQRLSLGIYEVIFKRDVRRGAYLATLGGHSWGGLPPAGSIGVMGRASDPRGVVVRTSDGCGNQLDAGFHLLVICPDGYA